ncbi:four-carbon acid sugar kinase family protein [Paenibacillus luteus]|uniref:four-carbon acid sugar kinase family protein n=1 Tax=Paenibacillus luteus TaxID=2545753 RepID=UPI0011422443|nr:four-carbon acid sugar kinase family protein [Paenibacillus luteus]
MLKLAADNKGFSRLLCYYGDDFTGSTDVLESLYRAGVRTALFLEPPSDALLKQERFSGLDAFGVAGIGRSLSPDEAEIELRPIFEKLKQAGAAIVHYKICSTFDSSRVVGNIGKAAEIGRSVFGKHYIPLLVGVPYLGRYTLFGNHFARAGEEIHRLDRHPTMSRHPVTPMKEADLRRHLAEQSELKISLMDILALDGAWSEVRESFGHLIEKEQPDVVLFDVLDEERLETAGQLIWEAVSGKDSLFVIGSSGIEYALSAYWRATGRLIEGRTQEQEEQSKAQEQEQQQGQKKEIEQEREKNASVAAVDQLLVVSGSCSPVTEAQIAHALQDGFVGIAVPASELIDPQQSEQSRSRMLEEASEHLRKGKSILLYSAAGGNDPAIAAFRGALTKHGYDAEDSSRLLGGILGSLARELIKEAELKRIVIAGGDTSGYVTRELGIYALECVAALAPGAPLCRVASDDPALDGLELALKGGQVGETNFFSSVKQGGVTNHGVYSKEFF